MVRLTWTKRGIDKCYILFISSKIDLDKEVKWFESSLLELLDKYTKILWVFFFQKIVE